MKSVPIMSAAPTSVMESPRQKVFVNFCLRISHAPNATQSGAVFPSKVALAAVVYEREDVHNARSQAVKTPARMGNKIDLVRTAWFCRALDRKNGNNKKIEKNKR